YFFLYFRDHPVRVDLNVFRMPVHDHLDLVSRLAVLLFLVESSNSCSLTYFPYGLFNSGRQIRSFDSLFLGRARSSDEKAGDDCNAHVPWNAHGSLLDVVVAEASNAISSCAISSREQPK